MNSWVGGYANYRLLLLVGHWFIGLILRHYTSLCYKIEIVIRSEYRKA